MSAARFSILAATCAMLAGLALQPAAAATAAPRPYVLESTGTTSMTRQLNDAIVSAFAASGQFTPAAAGPGVLRVVVPREALLRPRAGRPMIAYMVQFFDGTTQIGDVNGTCPSAATQECGLAVLKATTAAAAKMH